MSHVKVYRYVASKGIDLPEEGIEQLRLAHQLRNALIEIHQTHEERKEQTWRERPEVDNAFKEVERLEAVADEAFMAMQKSKRKNLPKGDPALKAPLTEARKELRAARATLKEVKAGPAYEALQERFSELFAERKAAIKATYREYRDLGLYWPTYNLTKEQFMRSVQAMNSARKAGKASALRFKRWTGEGQLAVQLQREEGDPARTPELLAGGESKWRSIVELPHLPTSPKVWKRKHKLWRPMSIRLGSADGGVQWLKLDAVRFHRPIPADADICDVKVSRRRIASHYRLSVEITAKLPDVEPSHAKGVVGINTGWRKLSDGSIRVATWRGKQMPFKLPVPPHLTEAIQVSGEGGEVRIPARWISKWEHVAVLESYRGKNLEVLKEGLLAKHYDELADHLEIPNDIKQWRSPARFAALSLGIRENNTAMTRRLEAWRKQDKHLWEWATFERLKCISWRKNMYANVGALLGDRCQVIAIESPYVAKVKRKAEEKDGKEAQAEKARHNLQFAAPSSLVLQITQSAKARGVEVKTIEAGGATLTHKACRYLNMSEAGRNSIHIVCEGCGEQYDQDVNAAWILVERAEHAQD